MLPIPSSGSIKAILAVVLFGALAGGAAIISWQSEKITTLKAEVKVLETSNSEQKRTIDGMIAGMAAINGAVAQAQEENARLAKRTTTLLQQLRDRPAPVTCEDAVVELNQTFNEVLK